jgi:hypothetical protein
VPHHSQILNLEEIVQFHNWFLKEGFKPNKGGGGSGRKDLRVTLPPLILFSPTSNLIQALSHKYGGHSSHVTNVAFLWDDSMALTTGGKDTSILQWRVV